MFSVNKTGNIMDTEIVVSPQAPDSSLEGCKQLANKLLTKSLPHARSPDIGILPGSIEEIANFDRLFFDKTAFAMLGMDIQRYVTEASEQAHLVSV